MRIVLVLAGLVFLPPAASAHHSRAHYTGEVRELRGEVVRLRWGNPHTAVMLDAVSDSGEATTWRIDFLGTRGLSREALEAGQRLTLAGIESSRGQGDLLATNVLLADGTELMLGAVEPFWSSDLVPAPVPTRVDTLVDGPAEDRGLFRVWSPPAEDWERYIRLQHSYYFLENDEERTQVWSQAILGAWRSEPYTESALAARADWDPVDNFATRCEPEGMPRLMMNPHPFEFVDEEEQIRLRSELYDIDRIIHMSPSPAPDDIPPSSLGHSTGRWEADTLVVETTRVNWPWLDNSGTPQSQAVEFEERFKVSADQTRLDYRLTVTDPATFTEPAVYDRYWVALVGATIQTYGCQVL
ncbi:MAG: DUF6152 family protein [Rhodospirillaceae bacterium]|nr:DUF6152 family protein [Rhodospirillaceae bacterium]